MNKRLILWGIPAAIWLVFTLWYTDFGGPLSEEEVAEAIQWVEERGADEKGVAQLTAFFENDTGRQFLMVNIMHMNENPPQIEGYGPDTTAEEYMGVYMEHMWQQLLKRACHPVYMGVAVSNALDIVGIEGARVWDTAALMRYKSRRAFFEIIRHPDMNARHEFKIASLTKTIAFPVENGIYLSDPRLLLFLVLGFGAALLDILIFGRRR